MEIRIVKMRSQYVAATKRLFKTVFTKNKTWGKFNPAVDLAVFDNTAVQWWIASDISDENRVVGFVAGCVGTPSDIISMFDVPTKYIQTEGPVGYLAEIGVSPTHKGKGIAGRLAGQLCEYLRTNESREFLTYTRPGADSYGWFEAKLRQRGITTDGRHFFGSYGVPTL